jgi:cell wall-associated NlpC family hydrolase
MRARDPRVTLMSADLAAASLEGVVAAPRYATPRRMTVTAPVAPLFCAADPTSERMDELVFGEDFDALDMKGGFAFGQARRDGYVGYVRAAELGEPAAPPTHRVAAIRTYAFAAPSIQAAPAGPFSLGALVAVDAEEGRFRKAGDLWFVAEHLAPIGAGFETDWATVAEGFLGTPYLWGGRTSVGLDCSGLVQQALYACGRACPRDADQQGKLGVAVSHNELARGDLVVWSGHIGIMLDQTRLLHANSHHMATAIEPVGDAIARIAAGPMGEPVTYRRL